MTEDGILKGLKTVIRENVSSCSTDAHPRSGQPHIVSHVTWTIV